MLGIDDAFVMVISHGIGPNSGCSFSFQHPRSPAAGPATFGQWRRSRPAVMVSLNVNHTTKAGRRLCIEA